MLLSGSLYLSFYIGILAPYKNVAWANILHVLAANRSTETTSLPQSQIHVDVESLGNSEYFKDMFWRKHFSTHTSWSLGGAISSGWDWVVVGIVHHQIVPIIDWSEERK